MKHFKKSLSLGLLVVIILLLRFSPLQRMIFFPGTVMSVGSNTEGVEYFETEDKKLSYKKHEDSENEKVLLYFLGNSDSITKHPLDCVRKLSKKYGTNIYIFDYRGCGLSEGAVKNDKQLYEDATAFFRHVKSKGYREENMYVFGESMGGAFAIDVASKHKKIGGLIIRSTFTSLYQIACDKISRPFAWLLVRYELDSISKISKVQCPVLAFHGKKDTLIKLEHGKKLRDAYKGNKRYTFIEYNGGHNCRPMNFAQIIGKFIKD